MFKMPIFHCTPRMQNLTLAWTRFEVQHLHLHEYDFEVQHLCHKTHKHSQQAVHFIFHQILTSLYGPVLSWKFLYMCFTIVANRLELNSPEKKYEKILYPRGDQGRPPNVWDFLLKQAMFNVTLKFHEILFLCFSVMFLTDTNPPTPHPTPQK